MTCPAPTTASVSARASRARLRWRTAYARRRARTSACWSGGLRPLRGLHGDAAHHGGRRQSLRDSGAQVQPGRLTDIADVPPAEIPAATRSCSCPKEQCSRAARWSCRAAPPTLSDTKSWAASATWSRTKMQELSPEYNDGKASRHHQPELGYLVRGGDPDAIDSIVPMAYGNLALDLVLHGIHGPGRAEKWPLRQRADRTVTASKKT